MTEVESFLQLVVTAMVHILAAQGTMLAGQGRRVPSIAPKRASWCSERA